MQAVSLVDNQIEARIFYENCPLCESKNLIKSVTGTVVNIPFTIQKYHQRCNG